MPQPSHTLNEYAYVLERVALDDGGDAWHLFPVRLSASLATVPSVVATLPGLEHGDLDDDEGGEDQ